jgi:hypothetical protein
VPGTFVVTGFKEVVQATAYLVPSERKETREALGSIGEIVRRDWSGRLTSDTRKGKGRYRVKSAAGLKVRLRQRDVAVEQILTKTTGQHSQYGAFQAIEGRQALADDELQIEAQIGVAMDKVVAIFNR